MKVKPLKSSLMKYVHRRGLTKKFTKQVKLLSENFTHPSLNTEMIQPRGLRLYSFRIDRKYRAIFSITSLGEIEVIDINDHYQ